MLVVKVGSVVAGLLLLPLMKRRLIELYKWWVMSSSVELVNARLGLLRYIFRGKHYKMFIPIRRGPSRIRRIMNEEWEDVTDAVRIYLGPCEIFQGAPTTPSMMGYKELHFAFSDMEDKSFSANQSITF